MATWIIDNTGLHLVHGLYGALSFDDGETWPVRRLISNESGNVYETTDGGTFAMTATNAEPRGYLSVTQTPDGVIQLISSRQHYAFNLAWLKERVCPLPDDFDCDGTSDPPTLVHIRDGLGALGDPTAFISPRSKSIGIDSIDILVSVPVHLISSCTDSTGSVPPAVLSLAPLDENGLHRVAFDGPIEVGEWTTVELSVENPFGTPGVLCFQIAHLPGDCNRDGQVSLGDATEFGVEFNGPGTVEVADLNGDGQVSLADATRFGQISKGASGQGRNPDGTGAWLGTQLPDRPTCTCP